MKRLLMGIIFLVLVLVFPFSTMASGGHVGIDISLPPPIVFAAPPQLVVIPETYVYGVLYTDVDIFFYNGWWWRPWEGRWYRSRNYSSGWGYYRDTPSFYREVPSSWRNNYRERRWKGHQWNYQQIPHEKVQKNWRTWEKNKYWEKQDTWGVPELKHRGRSQPQSREKVYPQSREKVQPQSREKVHQQSREKVQPQSREKVQPQHRKPEREWKGNK